MKSVIFTIAAIALSFLLGSCEKDRQGIVEGTYKGTFSLKSEPNIKVKAYSITLVFKDGTYTCSGDPQVAGSGTYVVKGDKIIIRDEIARTDNLVWDLILNGEYIYYVDGIKLNVSKETNSGTYEYLLERQ